ncbi:RNA-binding protein cabeza-like [Corticium candelabrum]|uniref:RNA-binding protein cabeza-like n=1 Tax=Corticium candelabrum TaxID=121492 RepID=UPI002E36B1EB|nr:RNA-binding protein cabeza-like [Corticium candelabrum]
MTADVTVGDNPDGEDTNIRVSCRLLINDSNNDGGGGGGGGSSSSGVNDSDGDDNINVVMDADITVGDNSDPEETNIKVSNWLPDDGNGDDASGSSSNGNDDDTDNKLALVKAADVIVGDNSDVDGINIRVSCRLLNDNNGGGGGGGCSSSSGDGDDNIEMVITADVTVGDNPDVDDTKIRVSNWLPDDGGGGGGGGGSGANEEETEVVMVLADDVIVGDTSNVDKTNIKLSHWRPVNAGRQEHKKLSL